MSPSRPAILALTLAAAGLALPARAQSPADAPLAESTFASGSEGWLSTTLPNPTAIPITVLGTFSPTWVASLGGYIRITDPDGSGTTGEAQYWTAPAAFLGAKSAAYGGSLEFDLADFVSGFPAFTQEDILLVGGGLTLVHALGGAPVAAFTHFSIPLSETGWTVGGMAGPAATAQQMQTALASIESLYVRAEYLNGPDVQYLDNVAMLKGPWTNLGSGLAGVNGVPSLVGAGTLLAGSAGDITLGSAKPAALAILFVSFSSAPVPFKGGTLVPVPWALTVSLATNGSGALTLPWIWPAGIPSGTALYFQYAIQDAAAVKGTALSNAVRGVTP